GPWVWSSGLSTRLPLAVAPYVDQRTGSTFPVFPYSAFVLAGTMAGAALGRRDPATRHRRALAWGTGLVAAGAVLARALEGRVASGTLPPGSPPIRWAALVLPPPLVGAAATAALPGFRALPLLGHEPLLVYCLLLYFLFGGVGGAPPLGRFTGR